MSDEEILDGIPEDPEDEDMEDTLDEDEDQIIELIDEQNNVVKFRLLDVTEYKGEKYTLLLAAEPNDEVADDEVVIFRLNEKEAYRGRESFAGSF
ncbi:MAG: DUF1292 domain-containing protein [Clostridia bacterium]|nr:DUF1292 domain-containing protein [Clostridia bacterium]